MDLNEERLANGIEAVRRRTDNAKPYSKLKLVDDAQKPALIISAKDFIAGSRLLTI